MQTKNLINHHLIIVTPVYEDIISFQKLLEDLKKEIKCDFYLIAVDDGSIHQPINLDIFQNNGLQGKVIQLVTNLGHQKAIAVGLNYLKEHLNNQQANIIIMDSDGEDKPSSIKKLFEKKKNCDSNIIVAQRKKRQEVLSFKVFYFFYKLIFKLLTGKKISFGNFMLFDSKVLYRITMMPELLIHLAACTLNSKLSIATQSISRGKRYDGKSKMNFNSLILHGFRALMVFIEDILVRIGLFCTLTLLCCIITGIVAICLKFAGVATPGWVSISLGVMLIIFLQTGTLTLMTLMLTGLLKGKQENKFNYKDWLM